MIQQLVSELELFVLNRGWKPYHHPKSLAAALLVEITELIEHFIPEKPLAVSLLKEEMGDVFNLLLLFAQSLELQTPLKEASPTSLSPISQAIEVVQKGGLLFDHFLWMGEEESKAYLLTEEVSTLFSSLFTSFLQLAQKLSIDPIEAGFHKLALNKKKYPVELITSNPASYRERKKEWKKNFIY